MPPLGVFVSALISVLLLSSCTSIQRQADLQPLLPRGEMAAVRSESIRLISRLLEEEIVPGLSIALVDREGPLWLEGFGLADSRSGERVDRRTVFRLGSLTKPVTAIGVLQLVAQGRIDLNVPLKEQLSDFSIRHHHSDSAPITPGQLLSHTSGLPGDLRRGMFTDTPFTRVTSQLHEEYAAYPAQRLYSYSNLGYDLLGHLIEQRSGLGYAEFIHGSLFDPLHMNNSGFNLTTVMAARLSAGHLDGQVRPLPPLRDTPALGLFSNADDMGLLMSALLSQRVPGLPVEQQRLMWQPEAGNSAVSLGVTPGFGWFIENHPVIGKRVRHGGATLLFGSEMALLPEQGLGIAVLLNGAHSNRIARELATTILTIAASIRGGQHVHTDKPDAKDRVLGYTTPSGGYATDLGLLMIDAGHPRLCACIIERILDLVRFEDGSLGLAPESASGLPKAYQVLAELRLRQRAIDGMDLLVAEHNGSETVIGNRIQSEHWESEWRDRLGSYRTINPDGEFSIRDLTLSDQDGVLCLHYRAPHLSENLIRVPLQPISSTEAVVQGVGRGSGETVRVVEINGKQCLKFSGYVGEPRD